VPFFTQKEKQIIRQRVLGKSLFLEKSIGSSGELKLLQSKLEIHRIKMIAGLQKTQIGMAINGLGVINKGRTNYRECLMVVRFFKRAMQNVGLLAIPSLRGLNLSFAERKLLMRIIVKKRQFLDMVLTQHQAIQKHAIKNNKIPPILERAIHKFKETKLSLEKDCQAISKTNYINQYTDINEESNVDNKIESYYWRFRLVKRKLNIQNQKL